MVTRLAVLRKACDEVLRCFRILLRNHALVLHSSLTILLAFFLVSALARHGAEDGRRRQDLVEVLELLPSTLLVAIRYRAVVDLFNIGEAVDYESAKQDSIANLVTLNRQAH